MCGIVGIFHYKSRDAVEFDTLHAITSSIQHRGKDQGYYINESCTIGLGQQKSKNTPGHKQPVHNEDKTKWIILDGTISNHEQLRNWLQHSGHSFNSDSPAETVLHLFEEEGTQAFNHVEGSFSIALFDDPSKTLFICRDSIGSKPLYYTDVNGKILFASELKAIQEHPSFSKELDYSALDSYLTFGFVPAPFTLVKGIHKLQPGHILIVSESNTPRVFPFREQSPRTALHITEREALAEYTSKVEEAVQEYCQSTDTPIVVLDGSVNSTLLAKLCIDFSSAKVHTVSVGSESSFSLLTHTRSISQILGTIHHQTIVGNQEISSYFSQACAALDEPFALPTILDLHASSKSISEFGTTGLTYTGFPELMATLPYHATEHVRAKWNWLLSKVPQSLGSQIFPKESSFYKAFCNTALHSEQERYLLSNSLFTTSQKQSLLLPHIASQMFSLDQGLLEKHFAASQHLHDSLSRMLYCDVYFNNASNIQLATDKLSMANSVQLSSPYLNKQVVEFVHQLPSSLKHRNGAGGFLHSKALKHWLAPALRATHIPVKLSIWSAPHGTSAITKLFNQEESAVRTYFNIEEVNRLLLLHQTQRENHLAQLNALLQFELWHRIFLETSSQTSLLHSEVFV